MARKGRISAPVVAFAFMCAACGGGDGGGSGGSGGSSTDDPTCVAACDVVRTCDTTLDVAACRTQCAKELGGQGYLIPEIANDVYQQLITAGDDPKCYYSKSDYGWLLWEKDSAFLDALAEQDLMAQCVTASARCDGGNPNDRPGCLMSFYRYNSDRRAQIETCFDLPCSMTEPRSCFVSKQVGGHPWIAGVH